MADAEPVATNADSHDLKSLLSSPDRDFLVRNNGDQVKLSELDGKTVGLYFSASWCGPCRGFTPELSDAYQKLLPRGDFEVVFVSGDEDEEAFNGYFSKMPWLAVPFSDLATRERLDKHFSVRGIPHLVILDASGNVQTVEGVQMVRDYGAECYPFTPARIGEIQEEEAAAKANQTLRSVLTSSHRDYVISNEGSKIPVTELEGKTVGLYFSVYSFRECGAFTRKLYEVYKKLGERGESFEVVIIPLDDDEESFREGLKSIPWLSLPFKDKSCSKLVSYFELDTLPTLVIIGPDGKTLQSNVVELIEEHGEQAYPFSAEKLEELAEIEKVRLEAQTLESLLISGNLDHVIGKNGVKIPVADLVGKNICLYFSAHWCPPCRAFLPQLIKAYKEIRAHDEAFEVIYISSDTDQVSFEDYFSTMPWLALPYGDERKQSLSRTFKIHGIPSLVAIGPTGRTVTKEARDLVALHGSDAYPFTEEHVKGIEARLDEMAKEWPEKLNHFSHPEHQLTKTCRINYICDRCEEEGHGWSYLCEECDFDLHPKCAFEEESKADTNQEEQQEDTTKEGWVCDGDVCQRA